VSRQEDDGAAASAAYRWKHSVAVFIAGDENIFFPALVALASVEEQNPRRFRKFICFEKRGLTPDMIRLMARYDIEFIDANAVPTYESVKRLSPMKEGKWPQEIMLNWALPEYFATLGFDYSVKLDYDVLCINPFTGFEAFTTGKILFSSLFSKGSTYVPEAAARFIEAKTGLRCSFERAINAGVAVFNNRLAAEFRFFETYAALYTLLVERCPELPTLEQVALAIIASNLKAGFLPLDSRYNHRIRQMRGVDDFTTDIIIIHYLTRHKPWRPMTVKDVRKVTSADIPILPFYRSIWLDYARTIDGFERYCSERPFTSTEFLCMAMAIFKEQARLRDAAKAAEQPAALKKVMGL
jgi:lipopolysaccharide biosynthesis glycosyltransferase